MAYPVLAILGEVAKKAVESEIVRSAVSVIEKIKAGVSDPIYAKVEEATRCAGKFFGISDVVDRAIDSYLRCDVFVKKTVFEFVFDRFKDLTGVSIEDLTKIFAHDYGSRNLENDNSLSAWAKELGADFFTGVRSEMLGLPKSDFEKILESVKGSETCPEGTLRVNAIQYGRDVVRRFQSNGIEPTIDNCKEAFVNSPYSKITYENHHIESNSSVWVDKIDSLHLETSTKERGIGAYPKFEKLSEQFKAVLSDKALEARVEAAAHSACKFFDIPDAELIKGDAIGVYRGCDVFLDNDVFEYNLDQFKDMKCVSFEDMTKIWAHECGHRILGEEFKDPWTKELGADFFSGVRSEMLGLPTSNFEKMLGSTTGSASHPVGSLRVQAIQFGREVVRGFQEKGITPTIENCKEAFANSPFSKITFESQSSPQYAKFIDDKGDFKIKLKTDDNGKTYSENGELVPNNEYKLNGYLCNTDELGRIILEKGNIQHPKEIVNRPPLPDIKDAKEGDHKGHIIARELGGADTEGNLVPMDPRLNQSDYRKLEIEIKKKVEEGHIVNATYELEYEDDTARPSNIVVTLDVDGVTSRNEFINKTKQ